ncbi:MAG: hypothetical protein ACOY71_09315 [Gemmatimonadota bacterium]
MPDAPPPLHLPGDPDAPMTDQVPLAVVAVPFGILVGTGMIAGVLWCVRTLQIDTPPTSVPDPTSLAAKVLILGSTGGVIAAMAVTWALLAPVVSWFRRGGLAMVAGFATVPITAISTPIAYATFGRWGLAGLLLGCVTGCLLLSRRLARLVRQG